LSTVEWKVVGYVNPKNSIQQIAHTVRMDDLEIRRVVYALLQAGLVELIRPDGMRYRSRARPSSQWIVKNKNPWSIV
jgi:hypothetical protein